VPATVLSLCRDRSVDSVDSVDSVAAVASGRLSPGLPYLWLGQGAPPVMALGGSAEHAAPAGFLRPASLSSAAVFARHFTVSHHRL
jgi:hypothetical protein